jgi:hypothetical protein
LELLLLFTVGYCLYKNSLQSLKQLEAADEMFVAQKFSTSNRWVKVTLYKLALNGSEGKFGFFKIADEYSGTDAGNLYYAGITYLNTGKLLKLSII